MEIILVRHGQTDSNLEMRYSGQTDSKLTSNGRNQVERTAQMLFERLDGRFDSIFTSPLSRAYDTARIIVRRFGLQESTIVKVKELTEVNFGIFENLQYSEIIEKYPEEYRKWRDDWENHVIKNGESSRMVYDRVSGFFKGFIDAHDSGTHIFAMHWGTIAHTMSYLLDLGIQSYWKYKIDNAGIVAMHVNDEKSCYLIPPYPNTLDTT